MKWERKDLIHATNLQKLLMRLQYDLTAEGVVKTYHSFNWLDGVVEDIERELSKPQTTDNLEDALKTANLRPNDQLKEQPVKPTKRPKKKTSKKA